jgi:hypothetical protein
LIIRHFVQHRVAIDPGIVHQDVEPAKLLVNALDQRVALTRIRNVQSETDAAMATLGGHAAGIGLIDIGTHDCGAFFSQPAGNAFADPAPGSRYDRDPAF